MLPWNMQHIRLCNAVRLGMNADLQHPAVVYTHNKDEGGLQLPGQLEQGR
jgi:hypothetical protein